MPGRPRTMLKRVDELAARAFDLGNELFSLMPAQYRESPNANDRIGEAWRHALDSATSSCIAIRDLRELIAEKVARAEHLAAIMESNAS